MYLFDSNIFSLEIQDYTNIKKGIFNLYSKTLNLYLVKKLWDILFVDSGTIHLFKTAIGKILKMNIFSYCDFM
jgi:hypothetical protein